MKKSNPTFQHLLRDLATSFGLQLDPPRALNKKEVLEDLAVFHGVTVKISSPFRFAPVLVIREN